MDATRDITLTQLISAYSAKIQAQLSNLDKRSIEQIAGLLEQAMTDGRTIYICGNGGSASNAMHIANDFTYGVNPEKGGFRIEALPSNIAVLTCLANDIGYKDIFSYQIKIKGKPGDILIVLSGSGNSPNIIEAVKQAKIQGMTSIAITGFDGGQVKKIADHVIHTDVNDMQVSEDMQLIIAHMLMQYLNKIFVHE